MSYKKILDMHTHTDNSFDGRHSTMFLCEHADLLGLRAVAFTDHVEMDSYLEKQFDRTALQSFFEISKARSAFRGRLIVCAGVELGQALYNQAHSEVLVEALPYDMILGSVHNPRGLEDYLFLDYSQFDIDQLLDNYFRELLLLTEWGRFDVLAHLTYPLRYIVGEHKIPVDMPRHQALIDQILRLLAETGKALEINTSGLRQKLGRTMPDEAIIRRFRELGGAFITIGSDAHRAEHLGLGIREGMDLALRCGFDRVTLYQNREPVQIPIE